MAFLITNLQTGSACFWSPVNLEILELGSLHVVECIQLEPLNDQKSNASMEVECGHWGGLEPLNDQKSNASMTIEWTFGFGVFPLGLLFNESWYVLFDSRRNGLAWGVVQDWRKVVIFITNCQTGNACFWSRENPELSAMSFRSSLGSKTGSRGPVRGGHRRH